MSRTIYGITKDDMDRMKKDDDLLHHIPEILLHKIDSLKHICYKEELINFKNEYIDTKYENIEEEYNVVNKHICNIMEKSLENRFEELMDTLKEHSIAEANSEDDMRERFIHPFQNFIMGAIIIDNFYHIFKGNYSEVLCEVNSTSIETSWLLASIFHDRFKPLSYRLMEIAKDFHYDLDDIIPYFRDQENYITYMSSLHSHLNLGHPLDKWKRNGILSADLIQILTEYAEEKNHGIMASFQLLRNLKDILGDDYLLPSNIQSALAIALHDHAIHPMLIRKKIFPLNIKHFPIPCLLLYCDAVQEWGRYNEIDNKSCLIDIKLSEETITTEVAFNSDKLAEYKIQEIEKMKKCIEFNDIIKLDFATYRRAVL